jgi:pimeloyl-ACP methyl ester carboxylesterase
MRKAAWLLAALAAAIAVGQLSGNQPERDAVAAAERELGIDLETARVDVGDVELFVVSAGPADGLPVILLHGFPEFWYAWAEPLGALARAGFRLRAPDQRGYDQSDKPRGVAAYAIDRLAGDVAGLVRALGHESACVVGHDWGGGVAWRVAIDHPQVVRRLAILDTPHPRAGERAAGGGDAVSWYRTVFQIPWLPEWTSRLANWRILAGMLRDTAEPGAFPDAKLDLWRSAWDRDGAFSTMVHWYRAAFRHRAEAAGDQRVHVPTLVILAERDAFLPAEATRASLDFVDDARLVELGKGSHWAVQEHPEDVARLLGAFCAEDGPARTGDAVEDAGIRIEADGDRAAAPRTRQVLSRLLATEVGRRAAAILRSGSLGSALVVQLNTAGDNYTPYRVPGKLLGETIVHDPKSRPTVETEAGPLPASPETVLAHELGHAVFKLRDEREVIETVENPIRAELGLPRRTRF